MRLSKSLNYENMKRHQFDVMAEIYGGDYRSYAHVIVHVIDVNDECPVFSEANFTRSVSGTPVVGAIAGMVKATDADNEMLMYTIVSGNNDGYFAVDNYGTVTVEKQFPLSFSKTYNLGIQVNDSKCEANTFLIVDVTTCAYPADYQFEESEYVYYLDEDSILGLVANIRMKSDRFRNFVLTQNTHFTIENDGKFFLQSTALFSTANHCKRYKSLHGLTYFQGSSPNFVSKRI